MIHNIILVTADRTDVQAAIPLSLYRKSMRSVSLLNPGLYDDIFNRYGSGSNAKNKHRIYIPADSFTPVKEVVATPNNAVLDFLEKRGFKIDNYALGTVFMPDGKRTTRIGKVLSKEPFLKKLFDNDPSRRSVRNPEGKMLVVISRHPYDVLGVSFDRGWTSCLNLKTGTNARKLISDLKYGLLVAYLVRNDDKNINRPSARILIRPYFLGNLGKEVVVVPDSTEYGSSTARFGKIVEKFCEWANSGSPKGKYSAPKGMYLNGEPSFVRHLVSLEDIKSPQDARSLRDPEIIRQLYKKYGGYKDWKEVLSSNQSTPSDLLGLLSRDPNSEIRRNVGYNMHTPSEALYHLARDTMRIVREAVARNSEASLEVLNHLARDREKYVRQAVAENLEAPPEVLSSLSLDSYWWIRLLVAKHPSTPLDILTRLTTDRDLSVRKELASNPSVSRDILEILLKDKTPFVRIAAQERLSKERVSS
jgi:3-methyladenine DNA glycosylase AlkC